MSVEGGPGGGAVPARQLHLEQTQWDGKDEWLGSKEGGLRSYEIHWQALKTF